jgi:C4-dicarboxylate-specific signal transduction histidine kinase
MLIVEHRRRRRVELQFRRSMSDLAHLNRSTALGELSASIAHELNQPLAAIMSNADAAEAIINKDPGAIAEVKLALADIRRDDQRASDIIRSMRGLFGRGQFSPQNIDVNEVIQEMLGFVAWEARSKDVMIATELGRALPLVKADRIQLDQVILNLLMNAIEAARANQQDSRRIRIATRRAEPDAVEVFVEDSGSGIPLESMSQIFEPHYTTKAQGMGMGLSISRTIIEAHGSRLNVRNLENGGACFWFSLATTEIK